MKTKCIVNVVNIEIEKQRDRDREGIKNIIEFIIIEQLLLRE